MADTKAKTTKKAVEVPALDDLRAKLATEQTDLLEARRSHAAGELVNPRVITKTRKEIARLSTAIRAAELAQEKESK
ncbi:MAG TPA: 50S ribosomal protein L29 [Candidatus Saccharibacteria bacterium]|nr:50S ribosomal protein L29 [Candidatus Saccharibacteria bacterium]